MENMKINNVLAEGPVSLSALERMFGVDVSEQIEKMAAAGDIARNVKGNYLQK